MRPLELMVRDASEVWLLVPLLFVPAILAILTFRERSWLGVIPLVSFLALLAGWYAYYALEAIPRRGGPESLQAAALYWVTTTALSVAMWRISRRRNSPTPSGHGSVEPP